MFNFILIWCRSLLSQSLGIIHHLQLLNGISGVFRNVLSVEFRIPFNLIRTRPNLLLLLEYLPYEGAFRRICNFLEFIISLPEISHVIFVWAWNRISQGLLYHVADFLTVFIDLYIAVNVCIRMLFSTHREMRRMWCFVGLPCPHTTLVCIG